uniref:Uncharacterized protein n=1 Tax=Physcomitrium patens TaxID=3218 RepID=A0A2K1ICE1_PHYPA|nr:hypothetical protein PHYPA_030424 [Physcomitrium patens]
MEEEAEVEEAAAPIVEEVKEAEVVLEVAELEAPVAEVVALGTIVAKEMKEAKVAPEVALEVESCKIELSMASEEVVPEAVQETVSEAVAEMEVVAASIEVEEEAAPHLWWRSRPPRPRRLWSKRMDE